MKDSSANAAFSSFAITAGILAGVFSVALVVQASTTIGTNISTAGTLTVTSTATSTVAGPFAIGTTTDPTEYFEGPSEFTVDGTIRPDLQQTLALFTTPSGPVTIGINTEDKTGISEIFEFTSGIYNNFSSNNTDNGWEFGLNTFGNRDPRDGFYFGRCGGNLQDLTVVRNDNVGVNTVTPYSRFQVTGADSGTGQMFGLVNSASTTVMQVLDNGNIGIGTTTPYSKFHVTSGANATTTVNFGEVGVTSSKACFTTKNTAGADISFYFVGTSMVIENHLCR
jgi:hypothetical protein